MATSTIVQIIGALGRTNGLTSDEARELGMACGELLRECEKLKATMTAAQLRRIHESLNEAQTIDSGQLQRRLQDVLERLWDELDSRVFYEIETPNIAYYERPESLIGADTLKAFPTAVPELIDSSKCLALGQSTACVFHLMRALEVGLRCMARVFGVFLGPCKLANDHRPDQV